MAEPRFGFCKRKIAIVSDYGCKHICENKRCQPDEYVAKWYEQPEEAAEEHMRGLREQSKQTHQAVQ